MKDITIKQVRGSNNQDGTWTLEVDVIEPDDTQVFPDGIKKTYHFPKTKFSSNPSDINGETFTVDF